MAFNRENVEIARYYIFLLMLAGALFGMVISPPVLSIALISIVVLGLLDPLEGINPRWRANIAPYLKSPYPWAIMLLYLLLLVGFWQTEDWPYYLERLRIKVPLLSLPLIWPGLVPLAPPHRGFLWAGFGIFMGMVLFGVLVNYGINFTEVNELVSRGQSVPVPRNHIRFSLLMAVAIFGCARAYELKVLEKPKLWLGLAVFLFVGLHFLAVRSGLAGAYAGIGAFVLVRAWRNGNWLPAAVSIGGLIALPFLAYFTVPSFQAKLDYARYELFHRDASDDTAEYSDEGRMTSIRLGWELFKEQPLLGVGPGNLRMKMDERYAAVLPGKEAKRPHNQFVSALAGSGVLGGLITLGAFLALGWYGLRKRKAFYLACWTLLFLSCLIENTLENTVGVSLFSLLFMLLYEPKFFIPPNLAPAAAPLSTSGSHDVKPSEPTKEIPKRKGKRPPGRGRAKKNVATPPAGNTQEKEASDKKPRRKNQQRKTRKPRPAVKTSGPDAAQPKAPKEKKQAGNAPGMSSEKTEERKRRTPRSSETNGGRKTRTPRPPRKPEE